MPIGKVPPLHDAGCKMACACPQTMQFRTKQTTGQDLFSGMQFQHQQESIHGVGAAKTQEIRSLDLNKNLSPFCF